MPSETERPLTYDDLLQIVELVKSSERFSEFRLKVGEIEIELRRDARVVAEPAASTPPTAHPSPGELPTARAPSAAPGVMTDAARAGADRPFDEASLPPGAIVLRAPMVGTFYRSPAPGAPPFVSEGQAVAPDTTVCIIEVMKLMNSIPAGERGTVRQILVADGTAVGAGAPLIVLDTQ